MGCNVDISFPAYRKYRLGLLTQQMQKGRFLDRNGLILFAVFVDPLSLNYLTYLLTYFKVTTHLENLEKSGNSKVVREKSGKMGKVRGNEIC